MTYIGFSENGGVEAFRCFLVVFEQVKEDAEANLKVGIDVDGG